jgi:acetoacetyl-CoA synthetase
VKSLPTVKQVVIVPYVNSASSLPASAVRFSDFLAPFKARAIKYKRVPFNSPLYILYSSGTTGVPKCIVHGVGGVLLMHLKEHVVHCDVKPGDRLFWFTTCGWMMWNWLVSGLAAGATLLLYDGSPFVGRGNIIFDYAQAEGMTQLGTSAKFIDAASKAGVDPRTTHKLPTCGRCSRPARRWCRKASTTSTST